jgi:hypothetical protein
MFKQLLLAGCAALALCGAAWAQEAPGVDFQKFLHTHMVCFGYTTTVAWGRLDTLYAAGPDDKLLRGSVRLKKRLIGKPCYRPTVDMAD